MVKPIRSRVLPIALVSGAVLEVRFALRPGCVPPDTGRPSSEEHTARPNAFGSTCDGWCFKIDSSRVGGNLVDTHARSGPCGGLRGRRGRRLSPQLGACEPKNDG